MPAEAESALIPLFAIIPILGDGGLPQMLL